MKILILSFYYPPDLCAGSFRSEALVKSLKNLYPDDLDLTIITTMPNRYEGFSSDALAFEKSKNIQIHRIQLPSHNSGMYDQAKAFSKFLYGVLRMYRKEDYDLIYGTSSRLMTAVLSSFVSVRLEKPLYLDVRDLFTDTLDNILPKYLSFFTSPFFNKLEAWSFSKATKINLVSKGFESHFLKRHPEVPLSFYTNGIDDLFLGDFSYSKLLPSNPLTILYAGNIGEGQGLHRILPDLIKLLEGRAKFRIIGGGGKLKSLKNSLADCNAESYKLLPPVNRSCLLKEYKSADVVFLHLNNYSAFKKVLPSKIFEYAAVGKPILAGLPGYSANFILDEISNAAVFEPCNSFDALSALNMLEFIHTDRQKFIEKYSRTNVMNKMAADILSIVR